MEVDVITSTNHPSTIGDDYVVYVDDITNPSAELLGIEMERYGIMLLDV